MTIGQRILGLRNGKKLSREALAGKVGITARSIENYEAGVHDPKGKDLVRIATALDTTVAYLVGETEDPSPDALKKVENYQLSMPDTELANASLMEIMEEELAAIRRIRIERERQIQSNIGSGKDRPPGA